MNLGIIDTIESLNTCAIEISGGFVFVTQSCDIVFIKPLKPRQIELCKERRIEEFRQLSRNKVILWLDGWFQISTEFTFPFLHAFRLSVVT